MSSLYDLFSSPNNNSSNTSTPNQPMNPLLNNQPPTGINPQQQQQGSSSFNMLQMRQQLNQIQPSQQPQPSIQQGGSVFSSFTVPQPQTFQIPNQQPLSQPILLQQSPTPSIQQQFPLPQPIQPPQSPSQSSPLPQLFISPSTPQQPNILSTPPPTSLLGGPNLNFPGVASLPPTPSKADLPFPPPITAEDDAFGLLSIPQSNKQEQPVTQSQIQSPSKAAENVIERVNYGSGDDSQGLECEKVMKYAAKHRENLEIKKNIEKITQQLHSVLWSFPTQDAIYDGICGCNVPVQYNYNTRIATFNQSLFENLSEKFLDLHEFNVNTVFMSLYQQTYSELQLSRYIHAKISTLRSIDNLLEKFEVVKELLNPLFDALRSESKPLTQHTKQLVSALVLYVGSFIVNYQSEEAPTIQDEILSYFVEQLAYSRAFTWGSRLIQININQLERSHLLQVATSNLIQLQNTPESEFESLIKQIQWKDIGMISSSKSVLKEILIPLKQMIEYSASKNYLKLLYLIGNILLLCSYEFPDVSFEFVSSITSGKWPMKLVCSGILQFIPLFALKKENLLTVFGNLYNLHNLPPLDYAKLPESQRLRHREDFIRYILNFPLPKELLQISGNEHQQEAQYQPILFIFYQLAGYSTSGSLFQRLIIQELFFISFSIAAYPIVQDFIQQQGKDVAEDQLPFVNERNLAFFTRFQQEAKDNLKLILIQNSELISTFIFSIGQNLETIHLTSLLEFLSADLFSNCSIDFYSAKWIGYLFNQRPFSSVELKDLVGNNQGIEVLLTSFLHPAPVDAVPLNPVIVENAKQIGNCLLNLVNWKKAHPVVKIYCALVILESSVNYSGSTLLLGSIGKQLLAPPYDELFLQHILNINFENYPKINSFEGILLQLLIALGIVSEQYRNIKLNQQPQNRNNLIEQIIKMTPAHTQSSIGHRWLLSWGFYTKLQFLLANYTSKDTISLLTKILTWLDVLKEEPMDSFPYIRSLIANFVSIRGINFKDISIIVQQSFIETFLIHKQPAKPSHPLKDQDPSAQKKEIKALSKEEMDEMIKRIHFWLLIIYPASRQERINCLLLNDFISYLYCTGLPLDGVVKMIEERHYTKDDVSNFASDGYHWFVLLILFSFKPVLPANQRDKNNSLSFLQTIAQQQSRNPVAIAYWLHFFMIYFANIHVCGEFVNKSVQDNLNKHFISAAKYFEDKNRVMYRLYYAFSSWKKAIIDSATGDFHEEQNIELLESIYSFLPDYFHTPYFVLVSTIHSTENENRLREVKFIPSASEETIEIVESLLPTPISFPKQILPDDMDTYTNVEQAISSSINILNQLFQSFQQRPSGGAVTLQTKNLPGLSQLTALLSNYRDKCNQLGMLDQDFLELTKLTHYNYQTPFQIQLPCAKGSSCIRPAIIQINGIKIDQAKPNAIADLQANRKTFNTEYLSFFNIASIIAQTVSIIKFSILSLFNQLTQSNANPIQNQVIASPNIDIFSIDSPSQQHGSPSSSVSAAINNSALEFLNSLFFLLLEFVLNEKESNLVALNSHFIELMILIGNKTIKNHKEYQTQLFNKLLETPSSLLCKTKKNTKKIHKIEEVPVTKSSLLIPPPPPSSAPEFGFSSQHEDAKRENKENEEKEEEEYFYGVDLYDLFTPECFLDSSRGTNNEYLHLLIKLVNSNKSEEELNKITSRFNIEILYDLLDPSHSNFSGANSTEQELDKIFSLIPLFLSKKAFSKLGSKLMEKLIVSNHQKRVFNLLFSELTPVEYSERFLANFNIEKLEASQGTVELLQNFTLILPTIPTKHLSTAIHWLRIITIRSNSFRNQLIQENPSAYDSTGKPIVSNLWNLLFHLFSSQGIFTFNDHQRVFNDQQLTSLFGLLLELIELLPNQLIDKLWYLLSGSIFPFLLDHLNYLKSKGDSFSSSFEDLLIRFSDFPWENTRILLYDPNALKVLNNYLFSLEILISPIFGKLNWGVFLKKLISSNQAQLINEFSVLFFKLFIQINQINPTAIPESLRDQIIPQPSQIQNNPNLLIDWRRIDPNQFKLILKPSPNDDGILITTLKNTKKPIHADQLQDNVEYLKNISIYSNQPLIGLFSLFEISSILFTNIKNEHLEQTFSLGNKQQTSLIASSVVPTIQHFATVLSPFHSSSASALQSLSSPNDAQNFGSKLSSPEVIEMIKCLFSLSEKAKHFQASSYTGEGSKKAFHSQVDENQTNEQLQQSVKGIIYQFCGASTPFIALQIIQIPPSSPQNQQAGYLPPNIWIQNIESTLRTFFSADVPVEFRSTKPLDVTSQFINLSGYDKRDLIALAKQESAAFTLLTILHQWRMEVSRMHESAQWPSDIFDCALHFKPNQYRLFDLLPLWFFILELVESPRFHPVQCQQDSWKFINYFKELFSTKFDPAMLLAARAVEIYFYRLIRNKSSGPNPKGDAALVGLVDKLKSSQKESQFKNYHQFFMALDNILAPVFTLEHLKMTILTTLVPTAQPMLEKFIVSPDNWR